MTPLSRKLLLAFAALGLAASSTSSYVHYKLLTDPSYSSFCDVNTTVSCTQAYLSPYGSFWGVPVALAGVFFFALVLLLAGVGGRQTSHGAGGDPGLHLRAVDRRSGLRPVSRLGVVLPAEDVLPAVRDHVRLGDCALHHFRWSHDCSHDYAASPRAAGSAHARRPARSRSSSRCCSSPAPGRSSRTSRGRRPARRRRPRRPSRR